MRMRAWLAVAAASCGVLAVAAQAPAQGQPQGQPQGQAPGQAPGQPPAPAPSPDRVTCGRASDPSVPLGNRGWARLSQQHREEALRDFDAAIDRSPANVAAHSGRAAALRQLGRAPEAIAEYTRALAASPNSAALLRDRGMT